MPRLVVDTNCLLATINPRGAYFQFYELFRAQAFEWVISDEIMTEYEEQLTRRYSRGTAERVHEVLMAAPNTVVQEAYYKWQLIAADPDDNKFADVAIAARADFLITNDRHFQPLLELPFPRVPVVSLADFLAGFAA